MTTSKNDSLVCSKCGYYIPVGAGICTKCGTVDGNFLDEAADRAVRFVTGPLRQDFLKWWKKDAERAKCTLEQAIGAYIQCFPARAIPLLVELLQ